VREASAKSSWISEKISRALWPPCSAKPCESPPPPCSAASAIWSAVEVGIPFSASVDSMLDLFSRIRTVPSTASPRLEPKLRTVWVMPVASP
jgi:hypothetical protein